jgi:hypothetical protein
MYSGTDEEDGEERNEDALFETEGDDPIDEG